MIYPTSVTVLHFVSLFRRLAPLEHVTLLALLLTYFCCFSTLESSEDVRFIAGVRRCNKEFPTPEKFISFWPRTFNFRLVF
jgi:hypothetical protein